MVLFGRSETKIVWKIGYQRKINRSIESNMYFIRKRSQIWKYMDESESLNYCTINL